MKNINWIFLGLLICLSSILAILVSIGIAYSSRSTLVDQSKNSITPILEPTKSASSSCKIGGCSGQLCIEEGEDGTSTCEYRNAYACYKTAICEKQTTGKCGWTQTEKLKQCILDADKKSL